jgi:Protein of unknown function (DUF1552)
MKMARISRRAVLRGMGATIALPFLDAMLPATAFGGVAAGLPPRRMAFIMFPLGAWMPYWMPTGQGPDYTMTPCLEPLAEHRKEMIVFGGLGCDKAYANGDGGGDHARAGGSFLTGVQVKKTAGANFQAGVSADQIAAARLGDRTRFRSLEMAIDRYRGTGNCDSGYSCVYEHTLSWRNATTPLPTEVNPKLLFDRLFGNGQIDSDALDRDEIRASVLDGVLEEARSLNRRLGGNDQRKLDQYLSGIREVEQRIARAHQLAPVDVPDDFERPAGVPADLTEHMRLMYDLMALAFQTDVTRIVTFMVAREGSDYKYRMVGVNEGHHTISHHQNRPANLAKLKAINVYFNEQLAYLISRLKAIKEGDGTLLDNCMIAFGSAHADPNRHTHDDLPVLLFGRGGGTIRPGRYLRYPMKTPLNNLWQSMLERFGVPSARFGDGTGPLEGLS